ncbi:MAG: hypothetical protein WA718_09165 [Terriglobales bacterium]
MPVDTLSGTGSTSRREAGTTAVSLAMAPTWAKISAVFFIFILVSGFVIIAAAFFAVEWREGSGEKIKGRPVAADEKTGEADILSFLIVREPEKAGVVRSRPVSLFIRLEEYPSYTRFLSRRFGEIMNQGL